MHRNRCPTISRVRHSHQVSVCLNNMKRRPMNTLNNSSRKLHLLVRMLFCILLVAVILSLPPAASMQTCSGSGCNGLDPEIYGCRGDASKLASLEFTDGDGIPMGRIEVYSSPTCQTIWTEVWSYWSGADIFAEITDPDPSPWHAYGSSGTGSWHASPMLYDSSPSGGWGYGSITKSFTWGEYSGWTSVAIP